MFFDILKLLLEFLDVRVATIPATVVHEWPILRRSGGAASTAHAGSDAGDAGTDLPSEMMMMKELLADDATGASCMVSIDWTAAARRQADLIVHSAADDVRNDAIDL